MKNLLPSQRRSLRMPLPSIKKLLTKITSNLKYELGELEALVEAHPEYFNEFKTTDSMFVETGVLLSYKIQRTSKRLLEQLDIIANAKPSDKLPVPNHMGSSTSSTEDVKPVRKRGRKAKTST